LERNTDNEAGMYPFEDGWIDARSAERVDGSLVHERDADTVRRDIEGFRGKVLSASYGLERKLDALIIWHLFRNREDGMAAFFEDNFLKDLGLERKVRAVQRIAKFWNPDDVETGDFARRLAKAKSYRDRVAHWPTRLQPLTMEDGRVADYRVHLLEGKNGESVILDTQVQSDWLAEIEVVTADLESLVDDVRRIARSGLFEE
jgi:hypothetical protein